jgi:hypothetical protein
MTRVRKRPGVPASDLAGEDQADPVRAPQIEVVTDELFDEDPPETGLSSIWVSENSACGIDTS